MKSDEVFESSSNGELQKDGPYESYRQQTDREHAARLLTRYGFILALILLWFFGLLVSYVFPQEKGVRGNIEVKADPTTKGTASWYPKQDKHYPSSSQSCDCILKRQQEYQAYLKERQQKTYGKSRLIKNYPPFKTQTCSGSYQSGKSYFPPYPEKKKKAEPGQEQPTQQSTTNNILSPPRVP